MVQRLLLEPKWALFWIFSFDWFPVTTWTNCFRVAIRLLTLNCTSLIVHVCVSWFPLTKILFLLSLLMIQHEPSILLFYLLWQITYFVNFNLLFVFTSKIVCQWLVNEFMPITKIPWAQSPKISHVAQPECEFLCHLRKFWREYILNNMGVRRYLSKHCRKYYRWEKVSTADPSRFRTVCLFKLAGFSLRDTKNNIHAFKLLVFPYQQNKSSKKSNCFITNSLFTPSFLLYLFYYCKVRIFRKLILKHNSESWVLKYSCLVVKYFQLLEDKFPYLSQASVFQIKGKQ